MKDPEGQLVFKMQTRDRPLRVYNCEQSHLSVSVTMWDDDIGPRRRITADTELRQRRLYDESLPRDAVMGLFVFETAK